MRYCLALDLKDDPALIAEYERHSRSYMARDRAKHRNHRALRCSIFTARVTVFFMIMETNDQYSPAEKAKADAANPKVQEWETLMWKFQQALPWAKTWRKVDNDG